MDKLLVVVALALSSYAVWPHQWERIMRRSGDLIAPVAQASVPMKLNDKVYRCSEVKMDKELKLIRP